jgi:hypothetical protein
LPVPTIPISRLPHFEQDQPFAPIGHGRFGVVPGCQLGGVGLDLMASSTYTARSGGRGRQGWPDVL